MKRILLTLAILSLPTSAYAQCNGIFPNNTVCGNITGSGNLPRPTSPTAFQGSAGGSNGEIQYNSAGALAGATGGDVVMSGDATLIQNNAVTTAKILDANITTAKILDANVTNDKIAAGAASTLKGSTNGTTTTDIGVANGLDISGGSIQITAARRTLPTITTFTTGSGTYTTPANVLRIRVRMIGGGGGGGGSGTAGSGGTGTTGNASCWRASGAACTTPLYQATGGTAGAGTGSSSSAGGTGGSCTGGSSSSNVISFPGQNGQGSVTSNPSLGGAGGSSTIGGGGAGGVPNNGNAGATNTGGGGQGASLNAAGAAGSGGGGGGACEFWIDGPAASYTYVVGGTAAGGTSGTSGATGGAGAAGLIIVEEFYNS